MANVLERIPVREQDPKVRATNFEEVCHGYNQEEAMCEASRCIGCKNAQCVKGCPVGINIPGFHIPEHHPIREVPQIRLHRIPTSPNLLRR